MQGQHPHTLSRERVFQLRNVETWAGCTLLLSPPHRGSAATYQKGVFQDGCLLPPSLHDQKEPQRWGGAGMKAEPVI